MKLIKILLAILGIVAVLNIIIVVVFLATFDANEYKGEMAQAAQKETGRELEFDGDVSLTLYPRLGMTLGAMQLKNAPGFGPEPMLEVRDASVSVDLLSLLSMQPQIDQLVLQGLTLRLQKNAEGKTNWDDLVQAAEKQKKSETKSATDSGPGKSANAQSDSGLAFAGSFGGLDVRDVQVLWQDDQSGEHSRITIETLATGRIVKDKAFPVQLNLSVQSEDRLNAMLALQASALLQSQRVQLNSLLLTSTLSGKQLPVDTLDIKLIADIDFDLSGKTLGFSSFSTTVQSRGGVLENSKTVVSADIGLDQTNKILTISALDLQSDLAGESVPNQKISVGFSSRHLEMKLAEHSIDLQDIVLALNDNRFSGHIDVADFARPDVRFELASKQLDVDALLGKADQPEEPVPAQKEVAEDIEIKLPMEMLRKLRLDGRLGIDSLKVQGLHLDNVQIKFSGKDGMIAVKPIAVDLYDGTLRGAVEINAQQAFPAYHVSQQLSGFRIGEFLQDFMQDDMISGEADLTIDLSTRGERLSQLKSGLNGKIGVKVTDGALKGFNLRQKIKVAQAKLKREKEPQFEPEVTDFSSLELSATITDGVLSTDDLDMQAPLIRVGGKGSVNLVDETLNYLVNAKLVATTEGQQGGSADELTGLSIPVLIKGGWLSPEFDVQLDDILKAKLNAKKEKLQQDVARQKEKIAQQLAEEKQKLQAAQQKQLAAKKQQLKKQQELAAAKEKERLKAIEDKKRAELNARKKQKEEEAKQQLQDKLKKLF